MKKIVVLPGGFHPFHAGHLALYKSAVQNFPDADVYVAASDNQKERPFPFKVKEALATVAGIPKGKFVQVKSPFRPEEITKHYNSSEDALIFVRSDKDRREHPKPGGTKKDGSPTYYQAYNEKNLKPFAEEGYIAYLPTVPFAGGMTSATEIRNAWPKLDELGKIEMIKSMYPGSELSVPKVKKLVQMLQNRRHVACSYITLLQKFKDCPNGIRSNTSHLAFFRPRNRIEKEAVMHELMPYDNKKNEQIFAHIFDNETAKFPFMFIDMSLKKSNKYLFYSNFNPLVIDEEVTH